MGLNIVVKNSAVVEFIQHLYGTKKPIHLHEPQFFGSEKDYLNRVIDSTFVSSVGEYISQFEDMISGYSGSENAVAVVNGTAGLHAALYASGVGPGDMVITQALTFVATCNAINMVGAKPIFVDVSQIGLGLCPVALEQYLEEYTYLSDKGDCLLKKGNKVIRAVLPVHTFGHPVHLDELIAICKKWNLLLIEDAAESLGSVYKKKHTGTFGLFGVVSFIGNKIITTGGGGIVLCRNKSDAIRLKHLTTTAKSPHPYKFFHDELGFNYRMPNLNAALGCAQLEHLEIYLDRKRTLATGYNNFFANSEFEFVKEPIYAKSNYWLNAIICANKKERDSLLDDTNRSGVMTRPIWTPMHKLPMYSDCERGDLSMTDWLEDRVVNLPSTPSIQGD